jgi:hypothetical protein
MDWATMRARLPSFPHRLFAIIIIQQAQAFAANLRARSARVFCSRLLRVNYSTNETAGSKKKHKCSWLSCQPGAMKSFKIMAADLYAHKLLGWWNQNFFAAGFERKKSGIFMRCVAVSRGVERKTG